MQRIIDGGICLRPAQIVDRFSGGRARRQRRTIRQPLFEVLIRVELRKRIIAAVGWVGSGVYSFYS